MPSLAMEDMRSYQDDGFLIVRGLFAPVEVENLAKECDRLSGWRELINPANMRVRFQPHVVTGEPLFEVFDPEADIFPLITRIATDRRIVDRPTATYGEPPCLFKDKLIPKPPGARGYDLHQDYIEWPGFPKSFVTVAIAIDAFDAASGGTELFAGCRRDGFFGQVDDKFHPVPAERVEEATIVPLDLAPGDAAFFGCLVPHRSAPNRGHRTHRGLFLSYNAASDGGSQRDRHYAQFHDYLRRVAPQRGVDPATLYFM